MAVITPNTDVYLLKVPLEINDINQLDFDNPTAQFNYFNSLPKYEVEDFTYQRKDGTIRFPAQYDEILTYNYVMYRNNEYSDKWFYAYITNMEYVNDNMTLITIKSDVWQCWQFSLNYKPCLIDREHVNDDTVGKHTLPEGLELGEFVVNGSTSNFGGGGTGINEKFYTVIEVSQVENRGSDSTLSYAWVSGTHDLTPKLNNTERGTIPLIIGGTFAGHSSGVIRQASEIVNLYDKAGLSESIINIYMLPEALVGAFNEIDITVTPNNGMPTTLDGIGVPAESSGVYDLGTFTFNRPTTLNGFIPKNGKLFTYPFCYFNISNNAGTSIPYRYEDFSNNTITFKNEGTFGISGNVKTIPLNYKNIDSNGNALDYSINGAKFPVCSWKSDSYTNWMTQNSVNMEMQWKSSLIGGALNIGSGVFQGRAEGRESDIGATKGGVIGGISATANVAGNLINTAINQHLAKTQANLVSDQVKGNLGAGDFLWAKYRSPFTYLPMCIKPEYSACIDQFFTQFGYKCNLVKLPNITGRRNWNYVKTIGCYIEADIPQEDLAEIKSMFDRGITIWHNPLTFADYSQNNDIII